MDYLLSISLFIALVIFIGFLNRYFYSQNKTRLIDYHKDIKQFFSTIENRYIKHDFAYNSKEYKNYWTVIISFNRKEKLKDLILSLKKFEPETHILVVDNGSKDNSQEMLNLLLNDGIIERLLLNNGKTIPQWQKSYALYQAFQLLKVEHPKYLGWIDDDVIVTNKFVNLAIKILNDYKHKNIKIVSLIDDEQQDMVHQTVENIEVDGQNVKIKTTFSGQFVFFDADILNDFGLPPIDEGINDLGVEDWYYSRMLQYSNSRAAAFRAGLHLGYDNSIRESIS